MAKTRDGTAVREARHAELGLTDEQAVEMYRLMALARAIDDRLWILNRMGQIHFVISCAGQEASQVGSAFAMRPGQDWFVPYYRDIGIVLKAGMTAREVLLSFFAKREDPSSGGRQMPAHYSHPEHKILSHSAPTGTQIPHAAGIAYASRVLEKDEVVLCAFGEGTTSRGDFHEGLNFASVHRAPVIFLCENNEWAISVPLKKQMAVKDVADRAAAYGMPGVIVDGNDPLAVYQATRQAWERARAGEGPTLIECKTTRFTGHSSDDNQRFYRSEEELEAARARDPLPRYRSYLLEAGLLDEAGQEKLMGEVRAAVDEATDYAGQAADPDPAEAERWVYATGHPSTSSTEAPGG